MRPEIRRLLIFRTTLYILTAVFLSFPLLSPALVTMAASREDEPQDTQTSYEAKENMAGPTSRKIRVAYPIQKGLTDIDENGSLCGYTYDYLLEIAEYTGWEYEFVMAEDSTDEGMTELMSQVDSGEIDLLGGTLYLEQLADTYLYSSQSYGVVETVLQTTPEKSRQLQIESPESQTMRIAVVRTSGRTIDELEDFCNMNQINPKYILCNDEKEQLDAVQSGQADALVNTSMNKLEDTVIIAHFAPKPFYFVTAKNGDAEMMRQLSQAIYSIEQKDPYFSQNLYEKYFEPLDTELVLTEKEAVYVKSADPIRVGLLMDSPPYQSQRDGEARGITPDILKIISKESGIQFEFVPAATWKELSGMAAAGELDLIAGLTPEQSLKMENSLVLSQPYLTAQYMMISSQHTKGQDSVPLQAILANSPYAEASTENNIYLTMADCMNAIKNRDADFTYVDSYTAQYFMSQPSYANLDMVTAALEPMQLCFGIVDPSDQTLAALLNKSIYYMPHEELQTVTTLNTMPELSFSIGTYIQLYPVSSIVIVSIILILFFTLLLLLLAQRMRNSRLTSLESAKRLRLYALTDDHYFEYDYFSQSLSISMPTQDNPDGVSMVQYQRQSDSSASETAEAGPFFRILDGCKNGVHELYQLCLDGKNHWLRMAFEVIYNAEMVPAYAIGKIAQIDKEIEEKEALQTQAQIDGLTGIYNAQAFQTLVTEMLSKLENEDHGAFLLLDIDHFKSINDAYGHMQGDAALCQLAKLLQDIDQGESVVGRFGGDEFFLYLSSMKSIGSLEKCCEGICQYIRYESAQSSCPFTISLGAALSVAGDTYDGLFEQVDAALYNTKKRGRNGYTVAGTKGPVSGNASDTDSLNAQENVLASLWIRDKKLEAILRALHAIVFEFHAKTGTEYISPFISEYLPGNYNGRPLSVVMLEDNIIHPKDIKSSLQFRESCRRGETGEMVLRLKTKAGDYHWHRMIMCPCPAMGADIFVGVLMDVDSETKKTLRLKSRAEYDSIAKIYNRESFNKATLKLLESEPEREHFLVRFDIDRFKLINELYSISEGDKILCRIGELLQELMHPKETYGRLRDDVFSFCVSRPGKEVTWILREIEQRLNETDLAFQFVISAGIVPIPRYQGEPISLLCDWAVMAQRTVKGSYISPFAFYEKSMSETLNREHFITASMQAALEHGQFLVYLQPQFNIQTGALVGAEALARWNHPDSGMVSPGEFIPLFERNGFILLLDEYIWNHTYSLMHEWLKKGYELPPISANVSRLHLYDPEFCQKIEHLSQKYELPPRLMHLEITESAYTECPEKLYGIMDELQDQGFSFSMDDFGSGYSSLNVLKDIPVDIVKIDLNFLQEARLGNDTSHTILEGTVRLVRNMGLPVIAEGVETREQLEFLKSIDCTAVQGYYYARPMPPEEFEKYLTKKEELQ